MTLKKQLDDIGTFQSFVLLFAVLIILKITGMAKKMIQRHDRLIDKILKFVFLIWILSTFGELPIHQEVIYTGTKSTQVTTKLAETLTVFNQLGYNFVEDCKFLKDKGMSKSDNDNYNKICNDVITSILVTNDLLFQQVPELHESKQHVLRPFTPSELYAHFPMLAGPAMNHPTDAPQSRSLVQMNKEGRVSIRFEFEPGSKDMLVVGQASKAVINRRTHAATTTKQVAPIVYSQANIMTQYADISEQRLKQNLPVIEKQLKDALKRLKSGSLELRSMEYIIQQITQQQYKNADQQSKIKMEKNRPSIGNAMGDYVYDVFKSGVNKIGLSGLTTVTDWFRDVSIQIDKIDLNQPLFSQVVKTYLKIGGEHSFLEQTKNVSEYIETFLSSAHDLGNLVSRRVYYGARMNHVTFSLAASYHGYDLVFVMLTILAKLSRR